MESYVCYKLLEESFSWYGVEMFFLVWGLVLFFIVDK